MRTLKNILAIAAFVVATIAYYWYDDVKSAYDDFKEKSVQVEVKADTISQDTLKYPRPVPPLERDKDE